MFALEDLYRRLIKSFGVEGLEIPFSAIRFYRGDQEVPDAVMRHCHHGLTVTSCQADRQAALGDAVCLTRETIGCVAAAVTFGLVDRNYDKPISDSTVYTDIMKKQSGRDEGFNPPSPRDFSEGLVYACKDSGRDEFALFGPDDSGRYRDVDTAVKAIENMAAVEPADTKAVFFYSYDFKEIEVVPDVVVLSVRPVELARIIQAYQFSTGERVEASMGGVRVVNSDLIVRPYITGRINISTYCVGARLIAQYGPDRMGIGIPYKLFYEIVKGMEESKTGYPFHMYPGA